MVLRGLSHLAVTKDMAPEALNREIIPYLRELGGDVTALAPKLDAIIGLLEEMLGGDDVAEIVDKLNDMIVILGDIRTNQQVPATGAVMGSLAGITTAGTAKFAPKATVRGITIMNLDATNNLLISTGLPAVGDVNTTTVKPGLVSPFLPCTNVSVFNLASSAGAVSACYAGA